MGNLRDLQSICLPTICVTIFHISPDHRRGSPLSLITRVSTLGSHSVSSLGSPLSLITRVSSQSHHSCLLSVSSLGSPLRISSPGSPLSLIIRVSSRSLIRPRTHFHTLTLTHHDIITSPGARGWILSQFLSNSRYLLYLTNPQ